jgi:hypothetical protein
LLRLGSEFRASFLRSRLSVAWTTPPAHFSLVILEMRSYEHFVQGWLQTVILLISASQVARFTGKSHCYLACIKILIFIFYTDNLYLLIRKRKVSLSWLLAVIINNHKSQSRKRTLICWVCIYWIAFWKFKISLQDRYYYSCYRGEEMESQSNSMVCQELCFW